MERFKCFFFDIYKKIVLKVYAIFISRKMKLSEKGGFKPDFEKTSKGGYGLDFDP